MSKVLKPEGGYTEAFAAVCDRYLPQYFNTTKDFFDTLLVELELIENIDAAECRLALMLVVQQIELYYLETLVLRQLRSE